MYLFLSLLMSFSVLAAPTAPEQTLNRFFNKVSKLGFQGQVSVSKGDQTLWQQGYGLAERKTGRAITEDTLFDIGSISKQITASALLRLQQQGRLNLDDRLSKYYSLPPYLQDVTIRQALQHRSGIGYPPDQLPVDLGKISDRPKVFYETLLGLGEYFPKREFYYNNLVYSALAELVHLVSGDKFENFVSTQLFSQAKLKQTGFNIPGSVNTAFSARGYTGQESNFLAGELPHGLGFEGATGVIINVKELRQWILAIWHNKIFPKALTEELFRTPTDGEAYALGWQIENVNGKMKSFAHGGSTIGFFSMAIFYPEHETSLIILSNDISGGWVLSLAKDVFDGQIPEEKWDEEIERVRSRFTPSSMRMNFWSPFPLR